MRTYQTQEYIDGDRASLTDYHETFDDACDHIMDRLESLIESCENVDDDDREYDIEEIEMRANHASEKVIKWRNDGYRGDVRVTCKFITGETVVFEINEIGE